MQVCRSIMCPPLWLEVCAQPGSVVQNVRVSDQAAASVCTDGARLTPSAPTRGSSGWGCLLQCPVHLPRLERELYPAPRPVWLR